MGFIKKLQSHWQEIESSSLWYISGIPNFTLPVIRWHWRRSVIEKQKNGENNSIEWNYLFHYTQNEQQLTPNLTQASFLTQCPKWKFSSQIDHSIIFTQICPKLFLYTNEQKPNPYLKQAPQILKIEILKSNRSFWTFYQTLPKTLFSFSKWAETFKSNGLWHIC